MDIVVSFDLLPLIDAIARQARAGLPGLPPVERLRLVDDRLFGPPESDRVILGASVRFSGELIQYSRATSQALMGSHATGPAALLAKELQLILERLLADHAQATAPKE